MAHSVNSLLTKRGLNFACVNAAIEESTLARRAGGRLLPQDEVLRDQLADGDVIIVSVGGNDIAFQPSLATIVAMLKMLGLPCCCCLPRLGGASDVRLVDGTASGLGHLIKLYGADTREYVTALLSGPQHAKPALVILNMIYYPLEANTGPQGGGGGWAELALSALGYNSNPQRLHTVIRSLFTHATSRVELEAPIKIVACPLYKLLDSRNPTHYVERVEPSAIGSALMAHEFVRIVAEHVQAEGMDAAAGRGAAVASGTGASK